MIAMLRYMLQPIGISYPAKDYNIDNVELMDNDGEFLLDNDGEQLFDNV